VDPDGGGPGRVQGVKKECCCAGELTRSGKGVDLQAESMEIEDTFAMMCKLVEEKTDDADDWEWEADTVELEGRCKAENIVDVDDWECGTDTVVCAPQPTRHLRNGPRCWLASQRASRHNPDSLPVFLL